MREIIITIEDNGMLDVREGERFCDGLSWGEMLEQVAAMTIPERILQLEGRKIYPMLTADEWEARRKKFIQDVGVIPGANL